jgi:hypothetical protein
MMSSLSVDFGFGGKLHASYGTLMCWTVGRGEHRNSEQASLKSFFEAGLLGLAVDAALAS